MQVTRTVSEVREAVQAARRAGRRVGLVPTMGSLHEGHLSLIRRATSDCDLVVVSVFVNPTQFNDAADLAAYPRDEARDEALACGAGATMVFAPGVEEVYRPGFATSVRLTGPLTETLEGAVRGPDHFWGVATVVTKLFGMVQPDIAYFGQKDAQQCVVVAQLVADLDIAVELVICPTVREADGLAMSSRNRYLSPKERELGLKLSKSLFAMRDAFMKGERRASALEATGWRMLERVVGLTPRYLAVVNADTMQRVNSARHGDAAVGAIRVGETKLIDNIIF